MAAPDSAYDVVVNLIMYKNIMCPKPNLGRLYK